MSSSLVVTRPQEVSYIHNFTMNQTIKVAIPGAAGESGGLVLNGLLVSSSPQYVSNFPTSHAYIDRNLIGVDLIQEVTALVRPSSISKPAYEKMSSRGVKLITIDLNQPGTQISESLQGFEVVIASVPPNVLESQIPLARAAKLANVKRFVPSSFAMAIAPSGVSSVQTMVRAPGLICLIHTREESPDLETEGKDLRGARGDGTSAYHH